MAFTDDIALECGIEPKPGFYRIRLVKGGAFVGARIYLPCPLDPQELVNTDYEPCERRSWVLQGEANGEPFDPLKIAVFGKPTSEAEYKFLMADRAWARANSPHEPAANPRTPTWEFSDRDKRKAK